MDRLCSAMENPQVFTLEGLCGVLESSDELKSDSVSCLVEGYLEAKVFHRVAGVLTPRARKLPLLDGVNGIRRHDRLSSLLVERCDFLYLPGTIDDEANYYGLPPQAVYRVI